MSNFPETKMRSFWEMQSMMTNVFSAYASLAASMMLFRSLINDIFPQPVNAFLQSLYWNFVQHFFGRFLSKNAVRMTIVIDEHAGMSRNEIYEAAEAYLRTKIDPNTDRLKVHKHPKQSNIGINMEKGQEVNDSFKGIKLKWQLVVVEASREQDRFLPDKKQFDLTFEKSNRDTVLNEYLPFVLSKAKELKQREKVVKLYTRDFLFNDDDYDDGSGNPYWGCINFDHPLTFDKLAMDPNLKRAVIEDLDRFVSRKDYYRKVGKAWKRGYLLYGPPGTGKSSLIAAMANYLKFDVYDLDLSSLYSNQDLRRVLLCTTNKSILVIEDIDCSSSAHDKEAENTDMSYTKLTLSGLLNFVDGLWSTVGDERIIIFTTNHKEKLDPALLRPGRMDMHIPMGYCTPEGFDVLAHNYLGIHDHTRLFPEIRQLIREVDITPAEIAEHLMRNEDVNLALDGVIDLLKQKKDRKKEMLEKKEEEQNRTVEAKEEEG